MLKVGIIGYGTIGRDVAQAILSGEAGNVTLQAILVRSPAKVRGVEIPGCEITDDPDAFFAGGLDLVIEAAGHEAVRLYGERALRSGSDLLVVAVGAFADPELFQRVEKAAVETGRQVLLPSAAIAGLDRIAAAAQGPIDEVLLVTRKPPRAWYGTIAEEKVDLANVRQPCRIFDGTARESAKLFPESVNVSAALSLAGIGFEKTKVQVYVDPTITQNTHEISARGHFGEVYIRVRNTPSAANPKTGYIVAMSIVKVLKNLTAPFVIGI
ncbi:aspartate dehydrogenase [Bacillaceae bacterium]